MNEENKSRRNFIKMSIVTGCLGTGVSNIIIAKDKDDPCKEELAKSRYNMSVWYEKDKINIIKNLKNEYDGNLVKVVKKNTIEKTMKKFKNMKIDKRDLSAVKKLLWNNLKEGFEFKIIKDTSETLEYKVTKCYYAEIAKELKASDIGFALHCAWDYGFCKGLNPEIELIRTKTLMEGKECCNFKYSFKK